MGEHQQGHFEGEEGDIPESSSGTSKKRALYICDNFYYSHVQLHLMLAKVLSENYIVDMIVYSKELGIFDWIYQRVQQQKYSFGIADFNEMAGSFAVFELLGIKKTFNVYPFILPRDLQFFGFNLVQLISEGQTVIPGSNFARPGDWVFKGKQCRFKDERFVANLEQLHHEISSYTNYYSDAVSNALAKTLKIRRNAREEYFLNLFKKISYHFVNQHEYVNFKNYPRDNKIVYIGGIHVEENEYFNPKYNKHDPSLVLVSFGTIFEDGGMTKEDVDSMIQLFQVFSDYQFKIKTPYYSPTSFSNIELTNKFIEQQQILFDPNTKLFISHCGLNSLTEAIYAGVPLICIPNMGDQFLNSSLVEHLGIGIYVSLVWRDNANEAHRNDNFGNEFRIAVAEMLENKKYQEETFKLRNKILLSYHNGFEAKNVFLNTIRNVIDGQ
uniref:UDP-glucuronosyltransferase n=1 Tax=Meloidogyne enterolobii TaxID=390850 RepID=A0A6V7WNQ0_MELEN|nr:unnamed protein product [Meloidogyne enterolobii]